jgi:glycosyltransferase involved in cell wall biosynthesis
MSARKADDQRTPKVSVVIPAYNAERFINETLSYIKNQTFKDFECIIVDDASTDKTVSIVNALCKKDPRFHLLHLNKNGGPAVARNIGKDASSGKFVIFLDADDFFDRNLLLTTYNKAQETNADVVAFNYNAYLMKSKVYSSNVIPSRIIDGLLPKNNTFKISELKTGKEVSRFTYFSFSACNRLYLSKFLQENKLRFMTSKRHEDVTFSIMTLVLARRITFVPDVLFTHRQENPESRTATRSNYPTVSLDVLRDVKSSLENAGLSKYYAKDFVGAAAFLIVDHVLPDCIAQDQQKIIESGPSFAEAVGINKQSLNHLNGYRKTAMEAFISGNYLDFAELQRQSFISEKLDLLSRIPPLEK